MYRAKVGDHIGTLEDGKVVVELYRTRTREGSQGSVTNEDELWVNNNLIAILRDFVEFSEEEVPVEILFPRTQHREEA